MNNKNIANGETHLDYLKKLYAKSKPEGKLYPEESDDIQKFINFCNKNDNPVPSLDILKKLLKQRKKLQNAYIKANNSEWRNEDKPLQALNNFDKHYSNILQNGVETNKEQLIDDSQNADYTEN